MRISTGMIFNSGVTSMQERTTSLLRTQQQISSGRRILTPSDDPVAAARALEVTQAQTINKQYQTSQENAKSALGLMDSQLSSMNDLLTRVRELTVQAGNAALSTSDRESIAAEIRARFDEFVGLANSTDGTGQYLFSGYQGATKPFAGSVDNGVGYLGDDGVRTLQVAGARYLPISNSGNDVFMRIKNGNGVFATGIQEAKSANVHDTGIDAGRLTDPSLWNALSSDVEVRFWVDAAGGGVSTRGYAVGNAPFAAIATTPLVIDTSNNMFSIALDGAAAIDVTVAQGTYDDAIDLMSAVQDALEAVAPAAATVTLDAQDHLVVTSNTQGALSAVALAVDTGATTTGFAALFGTGPLATLSGGSSTASQTFYDLVDKSTGNSLFTGAASTAAAGGTYTHLYASGSTIPGFSAGVFDLGAVVRVSGEPANGDVFTLEHLTGADGGLATSPTTISHANAVIDKGVVTDAVKWSASGNSQDMEIRFWVDTTNALGGGAGATYYDIVDMDSGNSLYTGTQSTTGAAGTYTNRYASVHGALDADPLGATTDLTVLANRTITAANDELKLTVDGVEQSVTLAAQAYATPQLLVDGINTQLGAIGVTASLDATGKFLVLSSNSVFGDSKVEITAPASDGVAALLGAATQGLTYEYDDGATINLKDAVGAAFDYGASVTFTGNPADGDVFTIEASTDKALGNGYFVTAAKTAAAVNMGGGIIGSGEVLDQAKWDSPYNSRQLEVRFWKDPTDARIDAPTYYDLVDARTEKSLFTDTTSTSGGNGSTYTHVFKSGDAIGFSGLAAPYNDFGASVTINGTPASGDVFTLNSSTSESLFGTLRDLIQAMESPVGPAGSNTNAELHNKLGIALTNIEAAADNFLRVRADIGTRLAEIDDLGSVSSNFDLQYASTLSNLQDIDYSKAITDLMRIQMELQAAQQSFTKISQLSLFNYL